MTQQPVASGTRANVLVAIVADIIRPLTGVSGLMYSEAISVDDQDYGRIDTVGAASGLAVVTWRQGQSDFQSELYAALGDISPLIPELLKGAWEDAFRDGAAAAHKAATCVVEAIDWTMRNLCDGVDLGVWLQERGLDGERYFDPKGKPTLAARTTYAIRSRSKGERELILSTERAVVSQIVALRKRAEARKHGGVAKPIRSSGVRPLIMAAEAFLAQILGL